MKVVQNFLPEKSDEYLGFATTALLIS